MIVLQLFISHYALSTSRVFLHQMGVRVFLFPSFFFGGRSKVIFFVASPFGPVPFSYVPLSVDGICVMLLLLFKPFYAILGMMAVTRVDGT